MQDIFPYNHLYDEDECLDALTDSWSKHSRLDLEFLSDKAFAPFELDEKESDVLLDIDPDLQYFNDGVVMIT